MKEQLLDIMNLIKECTIEMQSLNINVSDNVSFSRLDEDQNDVVANCVYITPLKRYSLGIDFRMLKPEANMKVLKGLIMHELLHTVPEYKGHDKNFQKAAKKIQEAYGYEPLRIVSLPEIYEEKKPIGKLECPICGMYGYIYEGQESVTSYCKEHQKERKKILFRG